MIVRMKTLAALLALTGIAAGARPTTQETVANLRAFAKLYGYVRFFHPSDEASQIDWDRFAIYGAGRVRNCASEKELEQVLNQLFLPLAPSLQVLRATAAPRSVRLPADTAGLKAVAWRHEGVMLGDRPNIYRSLRSNRAAPLGAQERSIYQTMDPPNSTARRVRLRVWARASGDDRLDPPGLWLSAAKRNELSSGSLNLVACPIDSASWRRYEAIASLPAAPLAELMFGAYGTRNDSLWLDDFEVAVENDSGRWQPLPVEDAGFEDTVSLMDSKAWYYYPDAVRPSRTTENVHAGARSLLVVPESLKTDTTEFFSAVHLKPGEYVDKALDRGLACRVPLCLYSDARHTLPYADSAAFARLRRDVAAVMFDSLSGRELNVRLGDVTITWDILQHFYPYFDVAAKGWDTVLTAGFRSALADTSAADFLNTLRLMAAALQDGHASVSCPAVLGERLILPCKVELVEGRVAVVATRDTSRFRPGDVVLAIDGVPAEDRLAEERRWTSGSPQFRTARALRRLVSGPKDSPVRVKIWRFPDTLEIATRYDYGGGQHATPEVFCDAGDSIRQLEPGIWFVDLNRAPMPAIDSVMDKLASARGVVFDLRRYPLGNHEVVSHLLVGPDTSSAWMQVPRIVYPDHERIAGWAKFGWKMQPKQPHIKGKVVFLTSSDAISYAESFMGLVEGYKLGEIVGQPTAGTNGNVNPFALPGGYTFTWTGMKVLKHDGSQHHLIGIQPTVPLERTLKALREGRDEYIEKAAELVKR
jgi:hypothetical protein